MSTKIMTSEPEIEVTTASAKSEEAMSDAHKANAEAEPKVTEPEIDPRLDGTAPGEVFARPCPKCGQLKMTADQSGKTACRRCRVIGGEPYESAALPPPPKSPETEPEKLTGDGLPEVLKRPNPDGSPTGVQSVGPEVSRVDQTGSIGSESTR